MSAKFKLIDLEAARRKEVVVELRALLAAAEAGQLLGIAYIVKVGIGDHRAGLAGTYRRHPEKALQATFKLERLLAQTGPFAESR